MLFDAGLHCDLKGFAPRTETKAYTPRNYRRIRQETIDVYAFLTSISDLKGFAPRTETIDVYAKKLSTYAPRNYQCICQVIHIPYRTVLITRDTSANQNTASLLT